MTAGQEAIAEITQAAFEAALIGTDEHFVITPLSGGVSCDVFRLDVRGRPALVAKRALAKLRVAADWQAPLERSHTEVAWLQLVADIDPRLVPKVVAEDKSRHIFFMEYLPEEDFPVWKNLLAAGDVDAKFAAAVGHWLARIHASTAASSSFASTFANQQQFMALRLDAYFLEAARRNPDVVSLLGRLVTSVSESSIALMQGDISPKNILRGATTPIFLDAETACYGDPAFDLAFCLNHLLLKCVWHPEHSEAYLAAFSALLDAYFAGNSWEPPAQLDLRAGALIAGLLLARVDGKSPVEYLTDERLKAFVREQAKTFLVSPRRCSGVRDSWAREITVYFAGSGTR